MAERITSKRLDETAGTLTEVMRRAGIITDRERVVRESAYGGHRFDVTGATIEDGTGHRTGVAGLLHYYATARETETVGRAVIGALYAASR